MYIWTTAAHFSLIFMNPEIFSEYVYAINETTKLIFMCTR